MATQSLDARSREVLVAVIAEYVRTAEPVGSRAVARRHIRGLSPATIRNIMADLEEMGYLCQPHTSAGRIPTGPGFRYYVNNLLSRQQLARGERDQLQKMAGDDSADADDLVRHASRVLSAVSRQACVVLVSRLAHQPLRSLSLLRAASDRILLVAVLQGGWVQHRLIDGEPDLAND